MNTIANLLTIAGFFYVMFRGISSIIGSIKKFLRGGGRHGDYVDSTARDVDDECGTDAEVK